MYVHIGGEISIVDSSVISVIDLDTSLASDIDLKRFINAEEDNNRLQYITGDIPKSLVLTGDRTYVSPVSSGVLMKRLLGRDYGDS